jgi:hypothetical protein
MGLLAAPVWRTFSGMKNACRFGSKAVCPACKGGTNMDDFVKDFLLAISATALAILVSGWVQWFKP